MYLNLDVTLAGFLIMIKAYNELCSGAGFFAWSNTRPLRSWEQCEVLHQKTFSDFETLYRIAKVYNVILV